MKSARPVLLLFALPAALVALCPAGHDVLLYNRDAVRHGELWRLWTGHWIHFSASHLGWNLLVLLLAGAWLEKMQPGLLVRYTALAAPLMGLVFLALAPDMQTYGGLSGLATGVVTLLALTQLVRAPAEAVRWIAVLLLVAGKIVLELGGDGPRLSDFANPSIHSSALAHLAGAVLAAALVFFPADRAGVASRREVSDTCP